VVLRLIEPLKAPETPETRSTEKAVVETSTGLSESTIGVRIEMRNISLAVSGHFILSDVSLAVEPGSHIAIVGPSGAGKSSLVGLLLGWFQISSGTIRIDEHLLDAESLKRLREMTAWIDPGVQLWNRSLEANLRYGSNIPSIAELGGVIELAQLQDLLETLPDGLQTVLGESGALVSGGEGQRVRLGRAMLRSNARLIVLDEPFAALDRYRREKIIASIRDLWRGATILYITHNIKEALAFDRVLVIESGRIIEDGAPCDLLANEHSHFCGMYDSDRLIRSQFMTSEYWRHLRLSDGGLIEDNADLRSQNDKPSQRLKDNHRRLLVSGAGTDA
jgi:ABC-type multidrug transport system fused ATPase/permease subunit